MDREIWTDFMDGRYWWTDEDGCHHGPFGSQDEVIAAMKAWDDGSLELPPTAPTEAKE